MCAASNCFLASCNMDIELRLICIFQTIIFYKKACTLTQRTSLIGLDRHSCKSFLGILKAIRYWLGTLVVPCKFHYPMGLPALSSMSACWSTEKNAISIMSSLKHFYVCICESRQKQLKVTHWSISTHLHSYLDIMWITFLLVQTYVQKDYPPVYDKCLSRQNKFDVQPHHQ